MSLAERERLAIQQTNATGNEQGSNSTVSWDCLQTQASQGGHADNHADFIEDLEESTNHN